MTDRKWRPVGAYPVTAGDHFGDSQAGESFVVTYHLDGAEREYQGEMVPTVRVSAYFGVELVSFLPSGDTRYSPVSNVSLERLDVYGEVIEEVQVDNTEIFPFDYSGLASARMDVNVQMWRWQTTEWDVADFWDGKDLPRD